MREKTRVYSYEEALELIDSTINKGLLTEGSTLAFQTEHGPFSLRRVDAGRYSVNGDTVREESVHESVFRNWPQNKNQWTQGIGGVPLGGKN